LCDKQDIKNVIASIYSFFQIFSIIVKNENCVTLKMPSWTLPPCDLTVWFFYNQPISRTFNIQYLIMTNNRYLIKYMELLCAFELVTFITMNPWKYARRL